MCLLSKVGWHSDEYYFLHDFWPFEGISFCLPFGGLDRQIKRAVIWPSVQLTLKSL